VPSAADGFLGGLGWGTSLSTTTTTTTPTLTTTSNKPPPPTTGERFYRAVEGLSRLSYGRADRREIAELGIADAVHVTRRGCGKPCVDGRGGQESDSGSWDAGVLITGGTGNLEPVGGFLDGLRLTKIIDSQVQLRGPARPAGLAD